MPASTDPVDESVNSRLAALWQQHLHSDTALLDGLLARHRERHRRYHTVTHVTAVVRAVDHLATTEPTDDLGAVIAAAFYHDAVYEPASPANELASARLARRDLSTLGWGDERAAHVGEMIEATRQHVSPPDSDHAVLFDADLAILGAPADRYDEYVHAVRAEYSHVDDSAWSEGRSRVLEGFLERDSIYATGTGRGLWESSARSNIAREISSLRC